jgi:hypothetical protein
MAAKRTRRRAVSKKGANVDTSLAVPTSVWSALGRVEVRMVEGKKKRKKPYTMGRYLMQSRHIEVDQSLAPAVQLQTFRHEWIHMVLIDAGLHNAFSPEQQETIADVIATALVAEMLNS